jgi:hypothetical protein
MPAKKDEHIMEICISGFWPRYNVWIDLGLNKCSGWFWDF